jgi:hypothetical protein
LGERAGTRSPAERGGAAKAGLRWKMPLCHGEVISMTRHTRGLRLLPALALIVVLFHPRDADAAFDQAINSLRDMVSEFVSDLVEPWTQSTVQSVTKVEPLSLVHGMEGGSHFFQHLSDAGYQLAGIDMSVGLIPDIKLTFQIVREISEADRRTLERSLEVDEKQIPGVTAMAQRQIIRTLLAVSGSEQMRVGKLVIGVLPLPSADFTIEPADAPLSEEHSALIQAIKNKAAQGQGDSHQPKQTP